MNLDRLEMQGKECNSRRFRRNVHQNLLRKSGRATPRKLAGFVETVHLNESADLERHF
jgi:hypothetical protein